jgi:hypothetical protein
VVIQATQPGTYYVMVTGNSVDGTENYSLSARTVPFSVSSITPDYGSNLGSVTLTINGAQFNANEQVEVVAPDGTVREADKIQYVNSTEVWATFNLQGLATGDYDVEVVNGSQTATLAHSFQVTNGPVGQVSVSLVLPSTIRQGENGVVTVDYANVGQTDIAAPIIDLNSPQALLQVAGLPGGTGNVAFLGTSPSGPAGVLQPGAQGSMSFSYTPLTTGLIPVVGHELIGGISFSAGTLTTGNSATASAILPPVILGPLYPIGVAPAPGEQPAPSTPIDWTDVWNSLKNTARPPTVDAVDWNNVWNDFVGLMGTTTASVDNALAQAATELAQVGQPTNGIGTLLQFELFQASGAMAGLYLSAATDIAAPVRPSAFRSTASTTAPCWGVTRRESSATAGPRLMT